MGTSSDSNELKYTIRYLVTYHSSRSLSKLSVLREIDHNKDFWNAAIKIFNAYSKEADNVFNNLLVLLGNIVRENPSVGNNLSNVLGNLVETIKEKTGQVRKTAAILLANICKDAKMLELTRTFHSTEVLASLAKQLVN